MGSILMLLVLTGGGVDRAAAEQLMKETPAVELIDMGRAAVSALGAYRYRMVKQERVRGILLPEQSIDVYVRPEPFAVRLHYVEGPASGRRVLYNPNERGGVFRVREAGVLSVLGALWVGVQSPTAKLDTNHTVQEAGLGKLLDRFAADLSRASAKGGMNVMQEGWSKGGNWCTVYLAPNGGEGFDAVSSRVCTDVETRLPVVVESFDAKGGVTERYRFSQVKSEAQPDKFFHSGDL